MTDAVTITNAAAYVVDTFALQTHRVVAHQGINAHQGEILLNSLGDQQPIKRVFMRRRQLIKSPDVRSVHRQQQPPFLFDHPAMNPPEIDHAAADLIPGISDATGGCGGQTGGFRQPPDQHTRVEKKTGATQGIRNSSARGASKSAWVCIFPSRPPGCRGAEET